MGTAEQEYLLWMVGAVSMCDNPPSKEQWDSIKEKTSETFGQLAKNRVLTGRLSDKVENGLSGAPYGTAYAQISSGTTSAGSNVRG